MRQMQRSMVLAPSWSRPPWLLHIVRLISPYSYQLFLLGLIPLALYLDVHTSSIGQQNFLGAGALAILIFCTRFSPRSERRQVWIMVGVATCVEIWSSLIWGAYRYRFGNVPLFVPWGHGLVYLFALRAARTPLLKRYGILARWAALLCAIAWAGYGLFIEPHLTGRLDLFGALWLPVFVWFLRKPSAPVFAAAFFIASYLEIWGTHFGNWAWQTYTPLSHIADGNPPSVISSGYCLMDFISLTVATSLPENFLRSRIPLARFRAAESRSAP